MREICLFNLEQAGIIVLESTGACYFNQVAGGERREAEGLFIPISNDVPADSGMSSLSERLQTLWRNSTDPSSNPSTMDINLVLSEISSSDLIHIDLESVGDLCCGWIPVEILPEGDFSQFQGFDSVKGILTWPYTE